jgi:hypothetical protein
VTDPGPVEWEYIGEVGVDAATVALWDRTVQPVE